MGYKIKKRTWYNKIYKREETRVDLPSHLEFRVAVGGPGCREEDKRFRVDVKVKLDTFLKNKCSGNACSESTGSTASFTTTQWGEECLCNDAS